MDGITAVETAPVVTVVPVTTQNSLASLKAKLEKVAGKTATGDVNINMMLIKDEELAALNLLSAEIEGLQPITTEVTSRLLRLKKAALLPDQGYMTLEDREYAEYIPDGNKLDSAALNALKVKQSDPELGKTVTEENVSGIVIEWESFKYSAFTSKKGNACLRGTLKGVQYTCKELVKTNLAEFTCLDANAVAALEYYDSIGLKKGVFKGKITSNKYADRTGTHRVSSSLVLLEPVS